MMAHRCPDGAVTRLVRTGPTGTLEGVRFHCVRCEYDRSAVAIMLDGRAALEKARHRLRKRDA